MISQSLLKINLLKCDCIKKNTLIIYNKAKQIQTLD